MRTITDPEQQLELVRVLAVLALLDGGIEKDKIGIVVDVATALHVQAEFVDALTQLHLDHARWAGYDMIRANTMTIPGLPWDPDDPYGPFHPYGGDAEDPVLVARFDRLVDLDEGTLGNALYHHYKKNQYAWPGDPEGLAELWAIHHDCLHLLSGYSTSAQGELLVAAFTGGHFDPHVDFMESHVLPTILIYHLGIDINKGLNAGDKARMEADPDWADSYDGNVHLGLDAAKLWVAIARGRAMTENVYSGHWDFWAHAPKPLEDLRRRWSIPPLDPAMAALNDDEIHRETTSDRDCPLRASCTHQWSPTASPERRGGDRLDRDRPRIAGRRSPASPATTLQRPCKRRRRTLLPTLADAAARPLRRFGKEAEWHPPWEHRPPSTG